MLRMPAGILIMAFAAGCAPGAPPAAVASGGDPCLIESESRDTLDVFLRDLPSAQHAPVPRNDSERLVFRQLYATLLRIDCTGAVRAGLAERWLPDRDGELWRLELGEHRFARGEPITAQRVVESFARVGLTDEQPWLARLESPGPRTLAVTLAAPDSTGPIRLANPALAIAGAPARPGGWPEPSGPFRVGMASDSVVLLVPVEGEGPVLRFRRAPSGDDRDLLEAGAGLLVTRDPAAIAYATRIPALDVVPLPWDVTYALVSPIVPPISISTDSAERAEFRASLARDAVRSAARGAEPPFGGSATAACRADFPSGSRPRPRVIYPEGDPTARELAERIVAIAPVRLTAAALPPEALGASLAEAGDVAFVVPFARAEAVSCRGLPPLPSGATIEPLVDTRAHLILRRDAPRLSLDADGVPRILP
jgi:hypothetical protein